MIEPAQVPAGRGRATPGADWRAIVARYQDPSLRRALSQVVTSHGAYVAVWGLMYLALEVSLWLALPLAVLAGGLMVRVFIVLHDCGHGSFFASRAANSAVGFVSGLLTFTPYHHWRGEHALHHKTSGDLDRRGVGDVWTMTVDEYVRASPWKRFSYRLARNPLVLFLIAPLLLFFVLERFPRAGASPRERRSVWWMNVALVAMATAMSWAFGLVPYAILQTTTLAVAGSAGVWLFYVQHQFEGAYWARGEAWDYATAALKGSSYYELPRLLQWFSGNIGFHHVHHLSPRIPNYNLEACHRSDPLFRGVRSVTLASSARSLRLRLWDESAQELVGFGCAARRRCERRLARARVRG